MTDEEHSYFHPGYKKPYPIETVLRDLAAQEGCDDEPYDAMVFAAACIEALTEQLAAARQDAKEAEAYAEELEKEAVLSKAAYEGVSSLLLSVQQDCIKERQRAERLEAKLASGVVAEYDDGSIVCLSGYAGGAADGGAWSTLTLMEQAPDGTLRMREYKAQGDWCTTLAEIKGESHE